MNDLFLTVSSNILMWLTFVIFFIKIKKKHKNQGHNLIWFHLALTSQDVHIDINKIYGTNHQNKY